MTVAALVLTDQNNAIGKNDLILHYLPAYVKYFEELTKDSPVVMGRRTFESIGHILRSRKNVVITKNEKYHSVKARTYPTVRKALDACKKNKKVFVIGGAAVYRNCLPYTTEIYRVSIKARFRADDYYPEIDTDTFTLKSSECISASPASRFDYCIEKWVRNSKPAGGKKGG